MNTTDGNERDKHYADLLTAPSGLQDYERVAAYVRAGCADTSSAEWADTKIPSVVGYLKRLLNEHATSIDLKTQIGGGCISLTVTEAQSRKPVQGSRRLVEPFGEACALLEESLGPLPVPGDDLRAIALLLGALADLEFAFTMPKGTTDPRAKH